MSLAKSSHIEVLGIVTDEVLDPGTVQQLRIRKYYEGEKRMQEYGNWKPFDDSFALFSSEAFSRSIESENQVFICPVSGYKT